MLRNFTSGSLHSHLIVIGDSVDSDGVCLLKAFAHNLSGSNEQVHLLCLENPTEKWKMSLGDSVHLHDCFSDHRGWRSSSQEKDLQHIYENKGLLAAVKQIISQEINRTVICIDSLTPVIFSQGLEKCYRDLHTLLTSSKDEGHNLHQLICLLHEDTIPNQHETLIQLHHLATTYLQLQTLESGGRTMGVVQITHQKPGGKVIREMEQYCIDENYSVTSSEMPKEKESATEAVDPTIAVQGLTTFKLKLEPKEEAARSQLVLPYIRQKETNNPGGGGQVFYQPDRTDDWDDEDPDDDLDV